MLKLAVRKIRHAWISAVLLFLLFTIILTLVIYTRSLVQTADYAQEQLNRQQEGEIFLQAETDILDIAAKGRAFSTKLIGKLEDNENVKRVSYSGNIPAYEDGLIVFRSSEYNQKMNAALMEGYDFETAQDTTLVGVSEQEAYTGFETGALLLAEGRAITALDGSAPVAVISEIVAANNQLEIGDEVTYHIGSRDGVPVSLRIIGIHRSTDTHNSNTDGYAGPSSAENLVFIPAGLAASLAGTDYLTEIRIQLCRIDQSDAVLDEIRETDATAMETANVITDNYEYQQKRALIFAQKNYYTVICWAAYGTTAVALAFLVLYLNAGRQKEFGILRSLGETSLKINMQVLLELMIPFIMSIPCAAGISLLMLSTIRLPEILQRYADTVQLSHTFLWEIVLMDAGMLLLAVGITFIQIYRKSPNELLRGHVR